MDNKNSVAFIGRINNILPITGADKIENVICDNWSCVTPKGEFKEGDLCVCITQDAVLPIEMAEKLGVLNYLKHRKNTDQYTVRTVKLKGCLSECILTPIEKVFPDTGKVKEGKDCMELLQIVKYEEPEKLIQIPGGKKYRYTKNNNFHIYHKFPNAKNANGTFNEEDEVVITRKIHGTNARYGICRKAKLSIWDKIKILFGNKYAAFEFVYGSHNVEKGSDSQGFYSTDVWLEIAKKYQIEEKLWKFFKDYRHTWVNNALIVYGEIYGQGIQGKFNYGLDTKEFAAFDIMVDGEYIHHYFFEESCKELSLPMVKVLYEGLWTKEEELKHVEGIIKGTKMPEEGIVVKSIEGEKEKRYKLINPEYTMYSDKFEIPDGH